jgi:hypothetical protein
MLAATLPGEAGMSVTYLDPTAETATPADPYELFLDTSRQPLRIGLLANAFPDAANFMDCMEQALGAQLPGAVFVRYQKPGVEPVAADVLDRIAAECDGLVAAWGH